MAMVGGEGVGTVVIASLLADLAETIRWLSLKSTKEPPGDPWGFDISVQES